MFTVQKMGEGRRGEERGVLRRGPGTITDCHYANRTDALFSEKYSELNVARMKG